MPVWKVAMIAADAVLGVLLAVLEIIAIKRFIDRRIAEHAKPIATPLIP